VIFQTLQLNLVGGEKPRPPPRCHLAGSLFATYMGSASGFLQTLVSGFALALFALPFRPATAGVLVSLLAPTRSSSVPCRAHARTAPFGHGSDRLQDRSDPNGRAPECLDPWAGWAAHTV